MPRAPKVCGHTNCTTLVHGGGNRCADHKIASWSSPRTASAQRTSTRAWKMQRVKCLQRDAYQCQIRGPRCAVNATEVDHVTAVSHGGSDDLSNLRAVCTPCHATKTGREGRNARP